ncbi:MAG: bacterio-opsin activator [Candidatus Caldipriscus sp.]|jgi:probable regulatory domain-containing protein|nr:bacterio-opsin activator [Candidatus Caldipriscus sp.]
MAILTPEEIREFDIDAMAIRVFLKSLELIGGPRKLIEYRNLTWIPSLMEASYAVVLQDMANKTEAEIAEFLGSTRQTVRNMLRAEPELVLKKLEGELEEKTPRAHTAGGLAKLAYKEIKEGRENLTMFLHLLQVASESLGVFWPVEILRRMKGADFPLGKEELLERLKGLKVKEKNIEEILEKLSYPVKSPADLLAQIRENVEAQ